MGKPCDYEAYDNNDEISIMMNFKWKIPFYVIIIWLLIYTVHNYFTNGYQNNELRYEVVFGVRMYIFNSTYFFYHCSRSLRSREGPFNGYKNCNPEQDIVFHKTHKCSSSSVQNILLRYALKHELNIVLPNSGNYLGRKSLFSSDLLKGTPWQTAGLHYNIFCLHNRWNGAEVEKLMGRMKNQRPVYFTILRYTNIRFLSNIKVEFSKNSPSITYSSRIT